MLGREAWVKTVNAFSPYSDCFRVKLTHLMLNVCHAFGLTFEFCLTSCSEWELWPTPWCQAWYSYRSCFPFVRALWLVNILMWLLDCRIVMICLITKEPLDWMHQLTSIDSFDKRKMIKTRIYCFCITFISRFHWHKTF